MSLSVWTIDTAASIVGFRVRQRLVSELRGRMTRWSAGLEYDPLNPEMFAVVAVGDVASVETGDPERDRELLSANFLNAVRYPEVRLRSTSVDMHGAAGMRVGCDLTIGRVTRSTAFLVEREDIALDMAGNHLVRFAARTSINRADWGLNWSGDPRGIAGFLGDRVTIEMEIAAFRSADVVAGQPAPEGDPKDARRA